MSVPSGIVVGGYLRRGRWPSSVADALDPSHWRSLTVARVGKSKIIGSLSRVEYMDGKDCDWNGRITKRLNSQLNTIF